MAYPAGDGVVGGIALIGDDVEFVGRAGIQMQFDGNTVPAQLDGVSQVFVAEDVQLPDFDVGGGQAGGVGDPGRRRLG